MYVPGYFITTHKYTAGDFVATRSTSPVAIDGGNRESLWSDMNWYSMNYRWLGEPADSTDYFGRFKVAWDRHRLYVLVDMVNDVLYPTMIDGVENYWKGDYIEKKLDENRPGADH